MRIKKIEVLGFKSFAEKQVVLLDDRVTAVLGPNGCGKSNIVDAIRWCLGEQRAKHLRGSGMSDVIFSGCASRGPAGMAEVTITFENEGDAPAAYLNYAEIAVSRRLFRDGTSEYLLNKVPCRLRDISEMLMGTGIGTKGYSIIEQGRVGQIVTSKPETRRQVIDEAAGITKFKAQKLTAERKISQTRQNLLRVADVIRELDGRLGTLRRQASKAERYKRYRDEQRDLELWMASHRYLELHATGRVLDERRGELADSVDSLRSAVSSHDAKLEAGRIEQRENESTLSSAQQRLYDLENRIGLLEQERKHSQQEQVSLGRSAEQSRAESEGVGRGLESLQGELSHIVEQQKELGSGEGDDGQLAVVDRVGREHDETNLRLRDARLELELWRSEKAKAESRLAALEAHLGSRAQGIEELETRLATIEGEAESLVAQREAEVEGLAESTGAAQVASEALEVLRGERVALDQERVSLRESLRTVEVEVETARKELLRARSRLQSLEEIQKRYRGCASGVQVVMEHREQLAQHRLHPDGQVSQEGGSGTAQVFGIMADFISAPAEYEAAVGAMLGEHLQGVVVDDPRTAASGVALLRDLQEGRTTFLPKSARSLRSNVEGSASASGTPLGWASPDRGGSGIEVVDLSTRETVATPPATEGRSGIEAIMGTEGVKGRLVDLVEVDAQVGALADALLADTIVVDTLSRALELWIHHRDDASFDQTLVTMDGDRLEPSGVVVGGSTDAVESALLQQKREIRELEEIAKQLEDDFAIVRARQQGHAERLRTVDEAREQSEQNVLEAEKKRLGARQRVESLEASCARLQERIGTVDRERARVRESLDTRQRERAAFDVEREQLRTRLPELESGETQRESDVETLGVKVEELGTELTEAKVALASWQEQCNALATTRDRLERQATSERDRARRLEEAAVESEKRIAELDVEIAKMVGQHADLLTEHKQATTVKHDASEACDATNIRVAELEVGIRNLRQDLDEERERLGEVELGLRELTMERDHLIGDIRDRFDSDLRRLLTDYHARRTPSAEQQERVRHLKRLLSRMGEVNLTAITEFEEVSARYEYLSEQRDDLEEAITKLQAAIDKINVTTRERFKETFEQVNAYFQKLFPRLFNGGRAELVMTDPSNLLETGIDILAQPPGKKVSSLELLSGGEKALTAVSLIFGIFLMKSSPFCLLDEVDAPLDDANVGRFCDMVRELSERTQFIIITHNKRTMEIADRLYGVTMQQRGISKLVSVNMRRTVAEAHIS